MRAAVIATEIQNNHHERYSHVPSACGVTDHLGGVPTFGFTPVGLGLGEGEEGRRGATIESLVSELLYKWKWGCLIKIM